MMNGFSSEPSSAFRSSPRIVHIATSISAAGRLANAPPGWTLEAGLNFSIPGHQVDWARSDKGREDGG